jgi:hypothetical protein
MKRLTGFLCALVLVGCGGSGKQSTPSGAPVSPKVAEAAALAKELEANPDDADAILKRHGMTRQQLEDLMYEIAADDEMSQAYARERGR